MSAHAVYLIALAVGLAALAVVSPVWAALVICGGLGLWTGWFSAHG